MTAPSPYDAPDLYDRVLADYREDLEFWLAEARAADGPVLEVACGTGRVLLHLRAHGADVDGLDQSEPMLRRLRDRAAAIGVRVHVAQADMRDFIRAQEEPLISSGPYAQYQVMREATQHVTVLLDGQGADEMMAGYIPYYFAYLRQLKAAGDYATLAKESGSSLDIFYRLGRFRLKGMASGKKTALTSTVTARMARPKLPNRWKNQSIRWNIGLVMK